MKNSSKYIGLISMLITYIVVKIGHLLAGFQYNIFSEGIFNFKFLIDIISWIIVYGIIYFLLKKLIPKREY